MMAFQASNNAQDGVVVNVLIRTAVEQLMLAVPLHDARIVSGKIVI